MRTDEGGDARAGAGFYGSFFGPMPFVFCPVPMETYSVWQFKIDSNSIANLFVAPSAGRSSKRS